MHVIRTLLYKGGALEPHFFTWLSLDLLALEMSSYKLYYFDARGRGEVIRIMLAQAGVKYEDIRYGKEDWASKYKSG